ncbi:MAG: 3-deoxy-D-manno-octulosonic acid transferase [Gammaproteobacteria bacterium]|nr:3-deoxy-D-manno-octulosonic acid transferase [Gammaproteobacteria bacterium]NIT05778.1 3-deoxy-D-manno-octulosonic acid transferase [Gammaproteobacteria bacterium]NIW10381.1 3-deoxy-D-manno-octulosonic acid transferase [Gammaproteobacteria bacterium]NIW46113.1 3-deoxy-D-manno-octulosonic acid transferase [Gammaproteobacteria bacterium]
MRIIYSLILYLLVPFALSGLLYQSWGNPKYRARWHERFGFVKPIPEQQGTLWIHAVSVGEVNATRPILEYLQTNYPAYRIILTTMTPTGADTVARVYGDSITHHYIPYDLPGAVKRFLRRIHPALLLVMETELWPNLFHHCHKNGIPILLANARMSAKSTRGYLRLKGLTSDTLKKLSCLAAQTEKDANRFLQLGAAMETTHIIGNLKFDSVPELPETAVRLQQRTDFSQDRPVWIAASTHEGEESIVLSAHGNIQKSHPDSLLIIAPRHPERFDAIYELSRQSGFRTQRKSNAETVARETQVFILDSLGELSRFYSLSDLAFVGGSLVPVGGHNMLEPASLGLPIITGPHKHNFIEISDRLEACGALSVIRNESSLSNKINQLLGDESSRKISGKAGRDMVASSRGSSERLTNLLAPLLGSHATY